MTNQDLTYWGMQHGSGVKVASSSLRATPGCPMDRLVVSHGPQGLDGNLLLRIRHGKGQIILCQLELLSNLERTPSAGAFLQTMIRQLVPYPASVAEKIQVLPENTSFEDFQRSLGDALTTQPSATNIYRPAAQAKEDEIRSLLQQGKTVWLHGMTPDDLSRFKNLLPEELKLTKANVRQPQLILSDEGKAALSDLTDGNLWWNLTGQRMNTSPLMMDYGWEVGELSEGVASWVIEPNFSAKHPGWRFGESPVFVIKKPLTAVLMLDLAGGHLLLDQTNWDLYGPKRVLATSLPMAIMNHLGVRATDPTSIKPSRFAIAGQSLTPLDIRAAANMAFEDETPDDKTGGWTDQGSNDLRDIPLGFNTFGGIPFEIIDPAANDGKSCIVLSDKSRSFLPTRVSIPIKGQVRRLYFLHTLAWAPKNGTEAYAFRVKDHVQSEMHIPIVTGMDTANWWKRKFEQTTPKPMPSAATLRLPLNTRDVQRNLFITCWENPNPTAPVDSLIFEVVDPHAVPVLIAVSIQN